MVEAMASRGRGAVVATAARVGAYVVAAASGLARGK